jgi:hypothetical protein
MALEGVWFVSLFCAALAFGLTVTHDLEIPGKQQLSGGEWLAVQHTFYGGFAILGGLAEVLGLLSTALLAYLLRAQRTAFVLTLIAAVCFAGMLAVFAFGNNLLNQQIAAWTPQTLPANWRATRGAWDGFHALSSVLAGIALVTLLIATLRAIPTSPVSLASGRVRPGAGVGNERSRGKDSQAMPR